MRIHFGRVRQTFVRHKRWLNARTGFDIDRCRIWVSATEKRTARTRPFAYLLIFFAIPWTVFIFSPLNPIAKILDLFPADYFQENELRHTLRVSGELLFIFGPILALPLIGMIRLYFTSRKEMLRCLTQPACFMCGHDCRGVPLDTESNILLCPECGTETPVKAVAYL